MVLDTEENYNEKMYKHQKQTYGCVFIPQEFIDVFLLR
jgi:hypothetical protein